MPRGGRIVNVGSVVSRIDSMPGVGVYGASKAAQEYLTAALAAEASLDTYCCYNYGVGLLTGCWGGAAWAEAGNYGQHGCAWSDTDGCCVVVP